MSETTTKHGLDGDFAAWLRAASRDWRDHMHCITETDRLRLLDVADLLSRATPSAPAERKVCRGCGKPIEPHNVAGRIADGCPCNSARGVNHGLVPTWSCTCKECDPAETGSARTPPSDREWLLEMAEAEDRAGCISVGGLAVDAGLYKAPAAPQPASADAGETVAVIKGPFEITQADIGRRVRFRDGRLGTIRRVQAWSASRPVTAWFDVPRDTQRAVDVRSDGLCDYGDVNVDDIVAFDESTQSPDALKMIEDLVESVSNELRFQAEMLIEKLRFDGVIPSA